MLNMFCSILYNKVVFSGWIYTAALLFFVHAAKQGNFLPFRSGMRWRRLIYRLLCRRNDLNTVSAKLVFQMRMNIKKHAVQRPKKYMWAVQLGRPHIFMQPLGRTFLYNLLLLERQLNVLSTFFIPTPATFVKSKIYIKMHYDSTILIVAVATISTGTGASRYTHETLLKL